jgi:Tfp pilus assembly protein PilP
MRRKLARPPVVRQSAAKPAAKPAGEAVKKAAIKTTIADKSAVTRRDPFVSPIREQSARGSGCSTGKKCLAIDAIVLRGIVSSQAGMIAVVESSTRRISYFLREKDPVFNGYVVRITPDTVVFRENVMDRLGKQSTRDVVMKVVAPVV